MKMKKDDTWKTLEDGATYQARKKSSEVKSVKTVLERKAWKAIKEKQVTHST